MFQVVRVEDGWQLRGGDLPIEEQLTTYRTRRAAVDCLRIYRFAMREIRLAELRPW